MVQALTKSGSGPSRTAAVIAPAAHRRVSCPARRLAGARAGGGRAFNALLRTLIRKLPSRGSAAARGRELFARARTLPTGPDLRSSGTCSGLHQRTTQETLCRRSAASRAQARRQPRLSRRAPRAAQHALAGKVASERRLSRAPRARAHRTALRAERGAVPAAAPGAEGRLRHL